MSYRIGRAMQGLVLIVLPLLCVWQLEFGFPLIWMPALLLVGIGIFYAGYRLQGRPPEEGNRNRGDRSVAENEPWASESESR